MLSGDPNAALVRTMRAMSRVQLQNRLMRLSAREIAIAMRFMAEADRAFALGVLPSPMAARVREEIALQVRRRVAYRDYVSFVRQVLASLQHEAAPRSLASYVRPKLRDPDRGH